MVHLRDGLALVISMCIYFLLCWLSLGDGFILGIFLGLGMVYEFDLLVRGLHPRLFIWYGLGVVEASWLAFYEGDHTYTVYI